MDEPLYGLGSGVKFKYMPYMGIIIGYNQKPGRFGKENFPYIIRRSDGVEKCYAESEFEVTLPVCCDDFGLISNIRLSGEDSLVKKPGFLESQYKYAEKHEDELERQRNKKEGAS